MLFRFAALVVFSLLRLVSSLEFDDYPTTSEVVDFSVPYQTLSDLVLLELKSSDQLDCVMGDLRSRRVLEILADE